MYQSIVDAGLKPYQLDRDERLLRTGSLPEQLKAAAEQAAAAADCILVTPQQIVSPCFPFVRCAGPLVVIIIIIIHVCSSDQVLARYVHV